MTRDLWINLPVKDVRRAREFFTQLGFSFVSRFPPDHPHMAGMSVGEKNVMVMLCSEPTFAGFAQSKAADARQASEVLLSIDAQSPAEVDALAEKVTKAGGAVYSGPGERDGWMYGCGFSDLDGHRWTVVFMDPSKMPKG